MSPQTSRLRSKTRAEVSDAEDDEDEGEEHEEEEVEEDDDEEEEESAVNTRRTRGQASVKLSKTAKKPSPTTLNRVSENSDRFIVLSILRLRAKQSDCFRSSSPLVQQRRQPVGVRMYEVLITTRAPLIQSPPPTRFTLLMTVMKRAVQLPVHLFLHQLLVHVSGQCTKVPVDRAKCSA